LWVAVRSGDDRQVCHRLLQRLAFSETRHNRDMFPANTMAYDKWMCIWMCPYNITAALIDQALGSHQEMWVTPGQQMMVKCSDWGCRPNQDWSQINVRHMQGVWQHSYVVDVNMDVSLQHYGRSHWPSVGKSPSNLDNSWATNDGEVQWLRL
jgi:hypothetical protein